MTSSPRLAWIRSYCAAVMIRPGLGRYRRCLHALPGVEHGHLIVEGGSQDRVQDYLALLDRRRVEVVGGLELKDPRPHMPGQDLDHPHRAQPRQDVRLQEVGVTLPRRLLDDVQREPLDLDVVLEGLPTPLRVTDPAGSQADLRRQPRLVGQLLRGVGPGRASLAADVAIHGDEALGTVLRSALGRVPHAPASTRSFVGRMLATWSGSRRASMDWSGMRTCR
jgi:hypothetical protein